MNTCQFANPRNKSSRRSRPLGGSIAVIRCAPLLIGLSLYNTNRAVYNKKDLPSDVAAAGQKPFFAVFGSRASSEMQEPCTNADGVALPASLRRAHRQERTAIAANFAG